MYQNNFINAYNYGTERELGGKRPFSLKQARMSLPRLKDKPMTQPEEKFDTKPTGQRLLSLAIERMVYAEEMQSKNTLRLKLPIINPNLPE